MEDTLAVEDNRHLVVAEGVAVRFDCKLVEVLYIDSLVEVPRLLVVGQTGHQPAQVNMAGLVGFQDFVLEEVAAEIFQTIIN